MKYRDITTTQDGGPSKVEANLKVARQQGRISYAEMDKWRKHYEEVGYEVATQNLLTRKADPDAVVATTRARRTSVSEEAYRSYAAACRIPGYVPEGYMRSLGT